MRRPNVYVFNLRKIFQPAQHWQQLRYAETQAGRPGGAARVNEQAWPADVGDLETRRFLPRQQRAKLVGPRRAHFRPSHQPPKLMRGGVSP